LYWDNGKLYLLDQLLLPHEKLYIECSTYKEVARAIVNMNVRGAPAIGVAAAYGMVLGAYEYDDEGIEGFVNHIENVANVLRSTRPTAVNLFWAIERMMRTVKISYSRSIDFIKHNLFEEAQLLAREDVEINKNIGKWGQQLLNDGDVILTHCNAGALATVGYGTALGIVRAAHESGKRVSVYADETRPYLQGARLTAWELMESGVEVTLITDAMAGHFLKSGKINAVIVGADRVARNGDVANKIGTYGLAVLSKENNVPFYVASPVSTLDFSLETGEKIFIEERDENEVTFISGKRIAPIGVKVANPAFDVTPNKYVTAIVTELGIIRKPYNENLKRLILS
jgi:methylthioribose-1-phosphate isomerase